MKLGNLNKVNSKLGNSQTKEYKLGNNTVWKHFDFGTAFKSNGTNSYAVRNAPLGSLANSMTMGFWLKNRVGGLIGSYISDNDAFLVSTYDNDESFLFLTSSGSLRFFRKLNITNYFGWNYFLVVFDGENPDNNLRNRVWQNGVELIDSRSNPIPTTLPNFGNNTFFIGGLPNVSAYREAIFNEVAIWENVVGDESNAISGYNNGDGRFAEEIGLGQPTSYYRFNVSPTATTIPDEGTANESLTLINVSSPPDYIIPH